ncbi:hypothetical protein [Actinomadura violacea]|uniref:Nudix hydrolase domain-containing protein n=1 Tax=Actinomadura violacea TaxID=2819934 RepID=A0ABS3S0R9_9ACTN|nr:hypothetical protein [Actinomadura violacea]MBO2462128.1 hypothetical protein [Actinomadura violacea]
MSWLPPDEYVRTLPNATMYAALYFTDTEGNPLALRSAHGVEAWQFPGGNVEHGDADPFAVFDGGVLTASELERIVLDPAEHTDWLVQPLSAWKATMSPRLFTRIAALQEARDGGSAAFLSDPGPIPM